MGLFSDETIISVSSTVYNLAGPEDKRPNFLKTAVASGILTPERSLTETITNAYLTGPGINFRNFGHWCENHGYNTLVGMGDVGKMYFISDVDSAALAPLIPHPLGKSVIIQTTEIGTANYSYWVDQYMIANHLALIGTAYTSDFDGTTITVTLADSSVETFVPADFDQTKLYLYASYVLASGTTTETLTHLDIFIYQYQSGNPTIDAFFSSTTSVGTYLPYIPLRVNNNFVSPTYLSDVYPLAKKALKKSIKANYDDLISKINDNAHLSDLDYVYVVFGVCLNTKENTARRYIYEFFQQMMLGQDLSGTGVTDWLAAVAMVDALRATYLTWYKAQNNPFDPLYGTPPPDDTINSDNFIAYPPAPDYSVRIASTNRDIMAFDLQITWNGMMETTSSGLGKVGAKKGDFWFEIVDPIDPDDRLIINGIGGVIPTYGADQQKILLKHQIDADTYSTLTVYGLTHYNYIYAGRSVMITAGEALLDPAESGFIIPLNTGIYRSMPLVASTQMSTACAYLVINAYQEKKIPWYASGFFQVFITIIIIVIAVAITVYTGGAATPGLLGTAGAVGAMFGATGTAAVIIGAAVNAIAAMIVVQVITRVSTAILGPKVGAIVGTIASIIAVAAVTSAMSGIDSATLFDQLGSAQNLMKLTSSLLDGTSKFIMAGEQDVMKQTQELLTSYDAKAKEIAAKYEELSGSNMVIDPMALTNTFQTAFVERPSDFFTRTLMTGSDISELSMDMITNYAKINLTTDLPV